MYSVDSGTGDTIVADRIGLPIDDVTIGAAAEDLVGDVVFWYRLLLVERLGGGALPFSAVP